MHSVRREKRVVSRKNQVFLSIAKKIIADRIVRSRWRWEERETEIVPKRIAFVSVELFQKLCLQTITQLIVTPTWKMITAWLWLIPDTRLIRTPSSHKTSSLMGQWRIERWDANELGLFCQQLDKSKLFTLYVLAIDGSFLKPNSQLKTVSFERLRLQFFWNLPYERQSNKTTNGLTNGLVATNVQSRSMDLLTGQVCHGQLLRFLPDTSCDLHPPDPGGDFTSGRILG